MQAADPMHLHLSTGKAFLRLMVHAQDAGLVFNSLNAEDLLLRQREACALRGSSQRYMQAADPTYPHLSTGKNLLASDGT